LGRKTRSQPGYSAKTLRRQFGENYDTKKVRNSKGESRRFVHNGRDEGFDASIEAYVKGGKGAVVMINANENSPMVSTILKKIAKEYDWPGYPDPNEK
jgi:hypothetical protein